MRKSSLLGNMGKRAQKNATYNATKAVRDLLFGEKKKKEKKQ